MDYEKNYRDILIVIYMHMGMFVWFFIENYELFVIP
jgi:hypothetical protein